MAVAGHRWQIDAELPGAVGHERARLLARFVRAHRIHEDEAGRAGGLDRLRDLADERSHRLFSRIEHCRHLAVGEGRYRRTLERHVIETAGVAAQGTIQLDADFLAQVVGCDTGLASAGLAVRAEAEAEEEAGRLAEWVGRPLVMEPMVEGHVADRLGHDGVDPGAGELGRGRPDVSANIGVCRAEIGQEAIAERVLDSGIGVALAESEVVQVDCPRAHGEIACAAHREQAAQRIDLLEHAGEVRLDALPAECSRIGAKEERSAIEETHPVYGVVWMNVARVVVDRRQLNGLEASTVARDIGHDLEPLVDEVTRKDHQGGLHQGSPH